MSRVSDHKHHYTDVIAGATIGFSVGIFVVSILRTNLMLNKVILSFFTIFINKDTHYG